MAGGLRPPVTRKRLRLRIYFARHGESQANLLHEISNRGLKHGLTLQGRRQALALSRRLQGKPITQIYSSPILRGIETSIILAGQLNLGYEICEALREYDCGELEARSDPAAWQAWQELFDAWVLQHNWEKHLEGGESFLDIRARFEPFIDGLLKRHAGTQAEIVCVSHGGLYWMMLPLILKNVDIKLISKYGFDYASCIVAELHPDGLFCVEWNGHPINLFNA